MINERSASPILNRVEPPCVDMKKALVNKTRHIALPNAILLSVSAVMTLTNELAAHDLTKAVFEVNRCIRLTYFVAAVIDLYDSLQNVYQTEDNLALSYQMMALRRTTHKEEESLILGLQNWKKKRRYMRLMQSTANMLTLVRSILGVTGLAPVLLSVSGGLFLMGGGMILNAVSASLGYIMYCRDMRINKLAYDQALVNYHANLNVFSEGYLAEYRDDALQDLAYAQHVKELNEIYAIEKNALLSKIPFYIALTIAAIVGGLLVGASAGVIPLAIVGSASAIYMISSLVKNNRIHKLKRSHHMVDATQAKSITHLYEAVKANRPKPDDTEQQPEAELSNAELALILEPEEAIDLKQEDCFDHMVETWMSQIVSAQHSLSAWLSENRSIEDIQKDLNSYAKTYEKLVVFQMERDTRYIKLAAQTHYSSRIKTLVPFPRNHQGLLHFDTFVDLLAGSKAAGQYRILVDDKRRINFQARYPVLGVLCDAFWAIKDLVLNLQPFDRALIKRVENAFKKEHEPEPERIAPQLESTPVKQILEVRPFTLSQDQIQALAKNALCSQVSIAA